MTLYELTEDYRQLLEMAEDPDADPEALEGSMESIQGLIEEKADGYARVMRQMDYDAKMLKGEEERLAARRKAIEGNIKRLKERLQQAMEVAGKEKFKTELFSFSIQNNPPSVVIDDEQSLPSIYWKPAKPTIDRELIKETLKNGEDLLLMDVAHLEQGRSLRIR